MMPSIGPLELMIVLVIAVIVIGPRKIPELGRSLGSGMREFKSSIGGLGGGDEAGDPTSAAAHSARMGALKPASPDQPPAH